MPLFKDSKTKKAKEENYDIVIIDTAGRLHNKAVLMEELKKMEQKHHMRQDQWI